MEQVSICISGSKYDKNHQEHSREYDKFVLAFATATNRKVRGTENILAGKQVQRNYQTSDTNQNCPTNGPLFGGHKHG